MLDAHVLLVEDESKLAEHLVRSLSQAFSVSVLNSFEELENSLSSPSLPFDVIILDRMMNGKDTLVLIPALRKKFPQCKILVLSAIHTPAEKALALDQGADDYVSKPVALEELMARVRAVTRRPSNELRFGNIAIDSVDRSVHIDGQSLPLSNKEFLLLRAFVQAPGKIFSKSYLYEQVWQTSVEIESNAIETTVNKLRRKLEDSSALAQIKNSRNLGYWLEE